MTTNAIVRKNELVQLLDVAEFALKEVSAGKVMKGFKEALGIVCRLRKDFICAVSEIIAKIKSELVDVQKDIDAVDGEVVPPKLFLPAPLFLFWFTGLNRPCSKVKIKLTPLPISNAWQSKPQR